MYTSCNLVSKLITRLMNGFGINYNINEYRNILTIHIRVYIYFFFQRASRKRKINIKSAQIARIYSNEKRIIKHLF